MKVNIVDLPDEGLSLELSLDEQSVVDGVRGSAGEGVEAGVGTQGAGGAGGVGGAGFHLARPARAELRVTGAGGMIAVQGSFSAELSFDCSRCLKNFIHPVSSSFSVYYERTGEGAPDDSGEPGGESGEREMSGGDEEVIPLATDEIDIDGVVLEHLALELPLKPLCSASCKGLCPKCGADLNDGPCKCKGADSSDPRLSALKDFKVKKKQ